MNRPGATEPLPGSPVSRATHYLQPGELFVATEPTAITTLLGSCISVCLWDPTTRVGGLNHFLLPQGKPTFDRPGRFGSLALPLLLARLQRCGANPKRLTAKVFGGSAMLANPQPGHIGAQNLQLALDWLDEQRIPVLATDTGGARGRKLIFHTDDAGVALWEL
jgi:chemotaxis protein CheD